jgi:hypothetical protein
VHRACEKEREEKRAGEETSADRLAPLGSEREGGKGARDRLPLTGGTRLPGAAGARARGLAGPSCDGFSQIGFSFFPEFPNAFFYFFSLGFSIPNSN